MGILGPISRNLIGSLSTRANAGDKLSQKAHKFLIQKDDTLTRNSFYFAPAWVRTKLFDQLVQSKIEQNLTLTVLNLGCGFDFRFERLDNGQLKWINVDMPEVIDLRLEFYEKQNIVCPPRLTHVAQNMAHGSVDFEYDLLVAEGFFMYIPRERADELIKGHCIFDVISHRRTVPLGGDQLWKVNPKKTGWPIVNEIVYDVDERQAFILETNDQPETEIEPSLVSPKKTRRRKKIVKKDE